jgi:hypothetical protein
MEAVKLRQAIGWHWAVFRYIYERGYYPAYHLLRILEKRRAVCYLRLRFRSAPEGNHFSAGA